MKQLKISSIEELKLVYYLSKLEKEKPEVFQILKEVFEDEWKKKTCTEE